MQKINWKCIYTILKSCPIKKTCYINDEIVFFVDLKNIYNILVFFKYHILLQFKILTAITAIDFPNNKHRFHIVYDLLSIKYNFRIKIKVFIHELSAINTCSKLFFVANWYECEIWDMFGIFFYDNNNLKKLLTDYSFEGFPFRKDFPLSGFIELRYHEKKKKIVTEFLKLSQEYRNFFFLSPWKI